MAQISTPTRQLLKLLHTLPRSLVAQTLLDQGLDGAIELLERVVPPRLKGAISISEPSLQAFDGRVVGWYDAEYPEVWHHIPDPPVVYFTRGKSLAEIAQNKRMVAVVGARKASTYGRQVAAELGCQLGQADAAVVSGLAYGIDIAAHQGCLQANAATVAILGSGLQRIYPAAHKTTANSIVARGGALVSEYAPDQSARPHHFLERNRLISGLCSTLVVVEAAAKSGALNTARWALEQGREVWAVPGNLRNPQAQGCHQLIDQGAQIVTAMADVVGAAPATQSVPTLEGLHGQVYELCKVQAQLPDQLLLQLPAGTTYAQLMGVLSELEVLGFVHSSALGYIASSKNTEGK